VLPVLLPNEIDQKIYNAHVPTLVCYLGEWEGKGEYIRIVEESYRDLRHKIDMYLASTEARNELVKRFGVQGYPILLIFKDGELVNQHLGRFQVETLKQIIEKHI